MSDKAKPGQLSRRDVIKGGGVAAVAVFAGGCSGGRVSVGQVQRDAKASFLSADELLTLDAVVERFIPADIDPGASAAGCADAINALLSAFSYDPPRIFAGAPFSDRGGHPVNEFENFLPLDRYEELAWRMKIEGSQGLPEREFNGPRKGFQQIYRAGLAQLNARAADFGMGSYSELPVPAQEVLLRDGDDALIAELVDIGFLHCLDAMYGAPEYGGNRDLQGWGFTAYDGDVQPRGYTDEQVTQPDNPGLLDLISRKRQAIPQAGLLPLPSADQMAQIHKALRELVGMHSAEMALGSMMGAEGRLSRLQKHMPRARSEDHS